MYYHRVCNNFQEKMWGYCQSANDINGYSIIGRQFLLTIQLSTPIYILYVSCKRKIIGVFFEDFLLIFQSECCWANLLIKHFYFNLSIDTDNYRMNSSPYSQIPVSYNIAMNQSNLIQIVAFDPDGDESVCAPYDDSTGALPVHVSERCLVFYKRDQVGEQFGQFWLID